MFTLYLFLYFIKDKVEELVVSLEHARHFICVKVSRWLDWA